MTTTTDPALKLQAVADALAAAFSGISGLTVYAYDVAENGVNQSKVLCVGDVDVRTPDVSEAGIQIGKRDWDQRWTLRLYHWLDDPSTDWASARGIHGAAVNALDFDHQLGGECREAAITDFTLAPNEPDAHRRMLVGEMSVHVLSLMPDPNY